MHPSLTTEQVAFIARETDTIMENIKAESPSDISNLCAGIITEETVWEESEDSRFNPDRRDIAESIIESLM
jgi:hypothetical protein